MRIALALAAAVAAALPAAPRAADPTRSASERLEKLTAVYVDGLFKAKPHLASYLGDRRFDRLVQDLSPTGIGRRISELVAQQKALSRVERDRLSPDELTNAEIMADGIALELLELRDIREWTWNPRLVDDFTYYDPREVVAARLADVVHGDWPEPDRLAAAAAQLKALPRYLAQRKAAFGEVSKVHLDAAVKDNAGRIPFFETELAEFTRKDPAAEKARVAAVAALQDYQKLLETDLQKKASRSWRLGKELFAKKYPHALQTDLAPDEVVRRATEAFRAARARLYEVALRLHRSMWPPEPVPAADAPADVQAKVIARVRDEIAKDHPTADGMVSASAAQIDGLRRFITEKNLIGLPPPDSLRVEPMPEFKRAGLGAEYLAPGLLGSQEGWRGTYYVDPPDPTWPADKIEGYLRYWNGTEIALTAAHEAYPGHHVQAWWSLKSRSPLRTALWSGTFAEGWAVYATTLVVTSGYGGEKNDRFLFTDLAGSMVIATNAIIDARLQGGDMPDQEALDLMVKEGYQQPVGAELKLLRAKLDSTQLSQYFIGTTELRALEADVRAKGSFAQRAFDEAVVSHGTIAVKHLRRYVLGK
jgi:uncharacterized protein (DUF885 family)